MLAEHPELIDRLYQPFLYDTHGDGGVDYIRLYACRYAGGRLRTFWHTDCFLSAHEYERAPAFDPHERAAIDTYDEIASRPELYLEMEFAKGDLWISLESRPPLRERIARLRGSVPMLLSLARGRIGRAVRGRQQRRHHIVFSGDRVSRPGDEIGSRAEP